MSFGSTPPHSLPHAGKMKQARSRVKAACDAANIAFLNRTVPEDVIAMIEDGVKIGTGGGQETAEIGRKHTKRTMPW